MRRDTKAINHPNRILIVGLPISRPTLCFSSLSEQSESEFSPRRLSHFLFFFLLIALSSLYLVFSKKAQIDIRVSRSLLESLLLTPFRDAVWFSCFAYFVSSRHRIFWPRSTRYYKCFEAFFDWPINKSLPSDWSIKCFEVFVASSGPK